MIFSNSASSGGKALYGQFHAQPLYPPGNGTRYPLDWSLGEPLSRSGCCEEKKNLAIAGNRIPAVQPVTVPTELSELFCVVLNF
jgi:hypothetical protein